MSNSLWSHRLQHTRPPCPSLSPWVCSNSCPLSHWYHPAISSSVFPFWFCPQSFPESGSYPMYRLVEFSAFHKELRSELICFSIFFQLVIIAVKRDKGCVNIYYLEKHKYYFSISFLLIFLKFSMKSNAFILLTRC